ncbi:MAG: Lrp/AsnC family transcriptional regulator [Acidobacteria bacterium]|nr:Lrp/AsnC family transcriptional regulator [Acidobacteriota bacterium]
MIDKIDKQILYILQSNARISNAEIARQVGLAPSAILERMRKLSENGVIKNYETRIEPKEIGLGLLAFVFVRTTDCLEITERELAKLPEVLEIHDVAGDDSYLLKVRTKDPDDLARLLREELRAIPNVIGTRTTVVLQTIKETSALAIDIEEPKKKRKKR